MLILVFKAILGLERDEGFDQLVSTKQLHYSTSWRRHIKTLRLVSSQNGGHDTKDLSFYYLACLGLTENSERSNWIFLRVYRFGVQQVCNVY